VTNIYFLVRNSTGPFKLKDKNLKPKR